MQAEGADQVSNQVRIGFLNEPVPSSGAHLVTANNGSTSTLSTLSSASASASASASSHPQQQPSADATRLSEQLLVGRNNGLAGANGSAAAGAAGVAGGGGGAGSNGGNGNGNGSTVAASEWADIYAQQYDIVLLADETFHVPLAVLEFLLSKPLSP